MHVNFKCIHKIAQVKYEFNLKNKISLLRTIIYKRGNFVKHNCVCTFSYPFLQPNQIEIRIDRIFYINIIWAISRGKENT